MTSRFILADEQPSLGRSHSLLTEAMADYTEDREKAVPKLASWIDRGQAM